MLSIGVLGLQGAFERHIAVLSEFGVESRRIRRPEDLVDLDGIVLPGGESTSMSNLLVSSGLLEPLRVAVAAGLPVLGTCAGLILLARTIIDGRSDQETLAVLDATVRRNAYGRQVDSFETDIYIDGLVEPFHAVFIRAPIIEEVGESVKVLASWASHPILIRQGRILGCSFHPELTDDRRIHQMFVELVSDINTSTSVANDRGRS